MRTEWLKIRFIINILSSTFAAVTFSLGVSYLWMRSMHLDILYDFIFVEQGPSFVTALCFSLAGIATFAHIWKRQIISFICYAYVVILCLYATFIVGFTAPSEALERQAHFQAFDLPFNISLSLTGMALVNILVIFKHLKQFYLLSLITHLIIAFYSFFSLSYFIAQINVPDPFENIFAMPVTNALGIFSLSVANLIYLINRSYFFNHRLQFLAPLVIMSICAGLIILIWEVTSMKERLNLEQDVRRTAELLENKLKNIAKNDLEDLSWLSAQIQIFHTLDSQDIIQLAKKHLQTNAFHTIGVIDEHHTIHILKSPSQKLASELQYYIKKDIQHHSIKHRLSKPNMHALTLSNNKFALVIYYPSNANSKKTMTFAVLDPMAWIKGIITPYSSQFYLFNVQVSRKSIYNNVPDTLERFQMLFSKHLLFRMFGHGWKIHIVPKQNLITYYISWVPYLVLVIGLIFVALITFITKILQMLRKEEEKNYLILHCAGEGIFGIDAEGKITFVNPAAENMLGWKYREVRGKPLQGVLQPETLDGTKIALEDSPIHKTYRDGMVREVNDERFINRNGDQFDVEYIARPLRDLHGALQGVVVTFKNITKRRELEKTLAKTNQELVTLSRYAGISEVSSGVLHNLGNILNNVNTSFHWIKEKLIALKIKKIIHALEQLKNSQIDPDKKKQYQEYINSALLADQNAIVDSIQEAQIVEDLITHAKNVLHTQQNFTKKVSYKEEVSVEQLLQEAVALSYLGSDLRISYVMKDCPSLMVDKHKAIQILINLIKNAYNAMKEHSNKKPELIFQCEKINGKVQIKIQDKGPGIPPEVAPQLFAFGVTSRKEGHGFGLHNSANLATEMQGRLFLESSTPAGTCFVLEIPT